MKVLIFKKYSEKTQNYYYCVCSEPTPEEASQGVEGLVCLGTTSFIFDCTKGK